MFILNNGKKPGPDEITNDIIKAGGHIITPILQKIFKYSFEKATSPTIWKRSTGIFIPKPGKDDYNEPKAYRTITLSPTLLKLQERLILWHLEYDKKIYDQLSTKQFGFRKGYSTEAALHKIIHRIEKRIRNSGMALGLFLDIEGAFDKVSFQAINKALNRFNIDETTKNWINSWLHNRTMTIEHKEASITIDIQQGCPQGL